MTQTPRDISPELVLVDPELASLARLYLPDPGSPFPMALEPDGAAASETAPPAEQRVVTRRKSWASTVLLTLTAASLAMNGVLTWQVLAPAESSAESSVFRPPLEVAVPRDASASAKAKAKPHVTAQAKSPRSEHSRRTAAQRSSRALHPLHFRGRASGESAGQRRAKSNARPASSSGRKLTQRALAKRRGVAHVASASPRVIAGQPAKTLRWNPVKGASYYDLVIWHDGKRVLDLWPSLPRIVLPMTWVSHGVHGRLVPGRYLWFVYPGFGAKASRHYGALAGSRTLIVNKPKGRQ